MGGVDAYGRQSLRISDWNLYYDTMLEIIDPERGIVLGSKRLSPACWGFVGEGLMFSNVYQENVIPRVAVWEATIEGQGRKEK